MENIKAYQICKEFVNKFENNIFEFVKNLKENKDRSCFLKGISIECDDINNLFIITMSLDLDKAGKKLLKYSISYDFLNKEKF